ncbi:glycosyltransferase family 2 protein [Rhodococcus sp. NPDC003382]|uniref:glycosyltransferase family 2 protein n=1 Tax=unclassified Rhodococcus (in: high G+C Gram-positive bacteria) TaxID=192944 RepID=UPI0018CEE064|nr:MULTISPECIES: glycosyltransferase family 2 protein [unclassified Rhodococcus (in: high G+C Gram-positive bacteria)]MBH0121132.1 glycosyltransferase family 2 protein [Rhodococcus sp. CX]MCK8672768.1 glycosyltransferase [Rhodococcus sp. HM1]
MTSASGTLVSVGLPVRNGADRIEDVVRSVLAQDHENLELVICDNASTDNTEQVCRDLRERHRRIVYHRHPVNVGVLNNYISVLGLATGTFFRWVGDDDWLAPHCISRSLAAFAADDRLVLVTHRMDYLTPEGLIRSARYNDTALGSCDPVTRFAAFLGMLNENVPLVDPVYSLIRREPALRIERRNMLREDEVFAAKLALTGPWAHVPEVLGRRNLTHATPTALARKLDVPSWQAHCATTLECREMLRALAEHHLDSEQRRAARLAVAGLYVQRQQDLVVRVGRRLARMLGEATGRRSR